jgi:hypothetical protein
MMHDDMSSHPPTEGPPGIIGRWEMLGVNFINSATHVALLPTNKLFIYGRSSLDSDEFDNPSLPRYTEPIALPRKNVRGFDLSDYLMNHNGS